jgi:hypothetical protein
LSKDLEKPLDLEYENILYEEYLNYENFIET